MVTFLIVENEPVVAAHTRREVERIYPDSTITLAKSVGEAVEFIKAGGKPDWVLLDLGLPDASGLGALRAVKPLVRKAKVVVISGSDDQDVREGAMRGGAFAFISKEFEVEAQFEALKLVLIQHVPVTPPPTKKRVMNGKLQLPEGLTSSQQRVLEHLRKGMSNKQIAQELDVTEGTVKKHLVVIFQKAGLSKYSGNKRAALLARLGGVSTS